jgi:hypothetical protein
MWELMRRNLLRERTRFLASIARVAFAVILMFSLAGMYNFRGHLILDTVRLILDTASVDP